MAEMRTPDDKCALARISGARDQLKIVENVLTHRATLRQKWKGADIERAWVNLHDVEVTILELTEPKELRGSLPHAYAVVRRLLEPDNPELVRLATIVEKPHVLDTTERNVLTTALRSAHHARAEQHRRLRSFRNTLLASAAVLLWFALLLGVVGVLSPTSVNLCFGQAVCPTGAAQPSGGDLFVVELLGVFGAVVVGAAAIRRMRGTSTPYAIPLASLLLKLPAGALTAVGGILLLKAGFVADVDAMSAAAIEAYAVLFGASQQAVTQVLDRQTQTVLDSVGTTERDRAPAPR